jgi:hypothetical protein
MQKLAWLLGLAAWLLGLAAWLGCLAWLLGLAAWLGCLAWLLGLAAWLGCLAWLLGLAWLGLTLVFGSAAKTTISEEITRRSSRAGIGNGSPQKRATVVAQRSVQATTTSRGHPCHGCGSTRHIKTREGRPPRSHQRGEVSAIEATGGNVCDDTQNEAQALVQRSLTLSTAKARLQPRGSRPDRGTQRPSIVEGECCCTDGTFKWSSRRFLIAP